MNHIVALSGGKDSTAMALRLREVEPRDYIYVVTPTGDELDDMMAHWRHLGELLETDLTPIHSGRSLQSEIRRQNHIPNWRQRWCTRMLKLEPFNAYLAGHKPAISYVGLRADEPMEDRQGNILGNVEGVTQRFPLREWGWTISDVWAYLDSKGITIPPRTDCARCFFQTNAEWWRLWKYHPDKFTEAEADEERTGHTFRNPGAKLGNWPASLRELREEFEKGRIPKGAAQLALMDSRQGMCRVCSL